MSPRLLLSSVLLALLPSVSHAVGGTGSRFRPAPSAHDGTGALQLVHPATGGRGAGYVGGAFTTGEYLALPDGHRRVSAVHLGGGFAVANWLRFETDLPYMTSIATSDQSLYGLGDLQLSATLPFTFPGTRGFGIGVAPFAELPTMAETSSEGVVGGGAFTLGAGDGALGWRANVAVRSAADVAPQVDVGIGGNARLGEYFAAGLEVISTRDTGPTTEESALFNNPLEATAYGVLGQDRPVAVLVGLTTGMAPDAGSPMYRATMVLSYRRAGLIGDPDGDGVFGLDDGCPNTAEDVDGFLDEDGCPEPDDDLDGVSDVVDRCPSEAEDRDGHEDRDGCPDIDNDFDGIFDIQDACPDAPGGLAADGCPDSDGDTVPDHLDACDARPGSPEASGCPDYDGDRVADYRDLCPTEPISLKIDPVRSNGCPTRAYYSGGRIEILERVNFKTGSAVIRSESFGLLQDVARTLEENPDILKVEIGGHTDSVGPDASNLRLSRARARSVRAYLISQGVSYRRLTTRGYGETRPLDSNETESGRYQNRRVEFVVLETQE